jgi:hypothetical protein
LLEREIRESLVFFLDILQAITITTLPIKSLSWKRSSCWRWQNLHDKKQTKIIIQKSHRSYQNQYLASVTQKRKTRKPATLAPSNYLYMQSSDQNIKSITKPYIRRV